MLSNAYFLAKFRFDTAENEPAKNLQKIAYFANFANFASRKPEPEKRMRSEAFFENGRPNREMAHKHQDGFLSE